MQIAFLAVLLNVSVVLGQNNGFQIKQQVQLLNSYDGGIRDMVFVSVSENVPFAIGNLDSNFPNVTCHSIGIAMKDVNIHNHDIRKDKIKPLFEAAGFTNEFIGLEKLWDLYRSNLDKAGLGFTASRLADTLVHESLRRHEFSKMELSLDFDDSDMLDYLSQKTSNRVSKASIAYDNWIENKDKIGKQVSKRMVEEELEPLALAYLVLFDSVMMKIFEPKKGCFHPYVNVGRYCIDDDCRSELARLFNSFAQDQFYGIDQAGESEFGMIDYRLLDENAPVLAQYLSTTCQFENDWKGSVFGIDIPGGNMLVADSVVLIGRDELESRFINRSDPDVIKRLNKLGIDTDLSESLLREKVTEKLETIMCAGKSIIWVGLNDVQQRYHSARFGSGSGMAYSPMYHIDVFISLFGRIKSCGDSLIYMLAIPDSAILNNDALSGCHEDELKAYQEIIRNQSKFITEVADQMEKEVFEKKKVVMKRITVPLPFWLPRSFEPDSHKSSWMQQILSPTNGFVENRDGKVTYYMPVSTKELYNWWHVNYQKALRSAEIALICSIEGITIVPVKYDYSDRSGLHCLGKVLRRNKTHD